MRHFLLLTYTLVVVVGTLAVSYTRDLRRTRPDAALTGLLGFLLCFNASVVVNQVFQYVYVNLAGSRIDELPAAILVATYAADLLVEGGMAWFLFLTIAALRDRQALGRGHRLAVGVALAFAAGLAVGAVHYEQTASRAWLDATYEALWTGAILVNGLALARLAVAARARRGSASAFASSVFAWLFLARYGCVVLERVLPEAMAVPWTAGTLLATNVAPMVWLRWYFVPSRSAPMPATGRAALDALSSRYRISRREREVVELLLQGKTYKEIQDVLFISLSTVKNHAYNIYQKLGVGSRGQLVNLVLNGRDERSRAFPGRPQPAESNEESRRTAG